MIHWTGTPEDVMGQAVTATPGALEVVERAGTLIPWLKRQVWEDQAVSLFALAAMFAAMPGHPASPAGHVLEIGTAWGFSAAVLALAAPRAQITTLNPKGHEAVRAREHLRAFGGRVIVLETTSDAYFAVYRGDPYRMIFVDGDHRPPYVRQDMRWFNHLANSGLILFHDYSPADSARPCPAAYETLNAIAAGFRPFDVLVMPDNGVGMCGWVRRPGEEWFDATGA